MSDPRPQSFRTHRRYDPLWHFVGVPILGVGFIVAAVHAVRDGGLHDAFLALYALAIVVVAVRAREQAKIVQDRVIRLEMRLRLREVLPPPMHARIGALTHKQLVGLRFASDAELPGLVERCLSGELRDNYAVKKEIRDWQADWLRA
ncbi:MAG TPA: DUF6526 family protein [Gemmatimonadaceae bacterium]|nr:DUF6526 family protein [Gemmatimonadaceae bacterium]